MKKKNKTRKSKTLKTRKTNATVLVKQLVDRAIRVGTLTEDMRTEQEQFLKRMYKENPKELRAYKKLVSEFEHKAKQACQTKPINQKTKESKEPEPAYSVDHVFETEHSLEEERQDLLFVKNIMFATKFAVRFGPHYFIGVQDDHIRMRLGLPSVTEVASVNIPFSLTAEELEKQKETDIENGLVEATKREGETDEEVYERLSHPDRGAVIEFDCDNYVKTVSDDSYHPVIYRTYAEFEKCVVWYAHNYVLDIIDDFEREARKGSESNKFTELLPKLEEIRTLDMWKENQLMNICKFKETEMAAAIVKPDTIQKQRIDGTDRSTKLSKKRIDHSGKEPTK